MLNPLNFPFIQMKNCRNWINAANLFITYSSVAQLESIYKNLLVISFLLWADFAGMFSSAKSVTWGRTIISDWCWKVKEVAVGQSVWQGQQHSNSLNSDVYWHQNSIVQYKYDTVIFSPRFFLIAFLSRFICTICI